MAIQQSLAGHKAMTRQHLWQRYREDHPDGLGYSAFCAQYARFVGQQKSVLRHEHVPGEALLIDYAGPPLYVTDRLSGEHRAVRLFVAVLDYSNYTFACATPGETTEDWLSAQAAALSALGGMPASIVPDNARALVSSPCRYEPELNPSYQYFARHYDVAVLPTRVRKPRDKAKAETAVQLVERALMPGLLARSFFSLDELNRAIREWIAALNARPFQKLPASRDTAFADERALLKPLPVQPACKRCKVHLDYHIEVDKHRYSVPHRHIGTTVDVRASPRMIEIFLNNFPLANHGRSRRPGGFSTTPEHRPAHNRSVTDTNLDGLQRQAEAIGPHTLTLIGEQGQHKKHHHETLRSAQGILRLSRDFTAAQLEEACRRALGIKTLSYRAVRRLIEHVEAPPASPPNTSPHENGRGRDAGFPAPPAQIRTSGITAYGSCLRS